jgi:hypothetical protein
VIPAVLPHLADVTDVLAGPFMIEGKH